MQGTPSVCPLPSLSPGTFSVYSSALWLVVCGCTLRDFCLFCLLTCHVKQLYSHTMSFGSLAIKAHFACVSRWDDWYGRVYSVFLVLSWFWRLHSSFSWRGTCSLSSTTYISNEYLSFGQTASKRGTGNYKQRCYQDDWEDNVATGMTGRTKEGSHSG